jgi:N-methylhydantoinase B
VSPLFYRYRRLRPGTGGAGRSRGGHAAEIGLTVRGIPAADALVMTHGAEAPNSAGLFGGFPGLMRQPAVQRRAARPQAGHDPDDAR